jgi:peptidoglycan/LPS O-acetylase OafA/YrhL
LICCASARLHLSCSSGCPIGADNDYCENDQWSFCFSRASELPGGLDPRSDFLCDLWNCHIVFGGGSIAGQISSRPYPAAVSSSLAVRPISAVVSWLYATTSVRGIAHGYVDSVLLIPFAPWVDDVYWTLGIEMAFYAMVWAVLALSSFERISVLCWVIGSASALYWIGGALIRPSFLASHLGDRRLNLMLVHHGAFFALGIPPLLNRWPWRRLAFAGLLLAAAAIQIIYDNDFADQLFGTSQSPAVPVAIFLLAVAVACVSVRCPIKSHQTLYLIGLATYPLYLVHYLYGAALLELLGVTFGINRVIALGITLMICIATSLGIVLAERPVRRGLAMAMGRVLGNG